MWFLISHLCVWGVRVWLGVLHSGSGSGVMRIVFIPVLALFPGPPVLETGYRNVSLLRGLRVFAPGLWGISGGGLVGVVLAVA